MVRIDIFEPEKTQYVIEACTTSKVYLDPGAGGVLAIEGGRATI